MDDRSGTSSGEESPLALGIVSEIEGLLSSLVVLLNFIENSLSGSSVFIMGNVDIKVFSFLNGDDRRFVLGVKQVRSKGAADEENSEDDGANSHLDYIYFHSFLYPVS